MSENNDFDGLLPLVGTFTVQSPAGGSVAVNIYGIEDIKLPDRGVKKDTFTEINGARTGKEQVILGSFQAGQIESKVVFQADNVAALDPLVGVNYSTIVLTVNATTTAAGMTVAATGGIEKMAFDRWEDSKHAVYSLTISVNAGWTLTPVPVA